MQTTDLKLKLTNPFRLQSFKLLFRAVQKWISDRCLWKRK